jgi:site-specific recombinase XerD
MNGKEPKTNSKYSPLLKDKNVSRWHKNVARGALSTADVALRGLGRFCMEFHTSPEELLKKSDDDIYDMLLDYVDKLESGKLEYGKPGRKAGSYVESSLKPVKSWLRFNGRDVKRRINISNSRSTPTLKDEKVPTQDELKRILLSSTKQTRVSCALMAFSGVRPEVLGDFLGQDGLRLGDIPDLEISENEVRFTKVPAMVRVKEVVSKNDHRYFTFIGPEGAEYITEYLNERIRTGERLTSDSPMIVPKRGEKHFIRTINIGDQIRNSIRAAGFSWRPYVLRDYFDTQLMMAESKRLILRDYRQFFMGHMGDIEHTYTVNKYKLPDDLIEDMRSSYEKSLKYVETWHAGPDEDDMARRFKKQILLLDGFTEDEIESEGLLELEDDKLRDRRREKLFGSKTPMDDASNAAKMDKINILRSKDGPRQRVVSVYALEAYINEGFVSNGNVLPGEKVLVELPNGH